MIHDCSVLFGEDASKCSANVYAEVCSHLVKTLNVSPQIEA